MEINNYGGIFGGQGVLQSAGDRTGYSVCVWGGRGMKCGERKRASGIFALRSLNMWLGILDLKREGLILSFQPEKVLPRFY